ncbi:hypothetical protein FH609_001510 [Streptomyces sp. 3MP-14]|uniref:Uncharacterized protein n=1 Tax=Streptomyces mimosae TaxID=2586635 RepID=A0A5N6AS71_9ACTN|nr:MULTISPECIES: hypothetical protein [Streptomyces]KAB8170946.1 hypothetical protein FH607_000960 [Streptomyces mimosae]KAB8179703.1 hypothetical protein FH609_001510 [Streptomyces sp. 3MP-14]
MLLPAGLAAAIVLTSCGGEESSGGVVEGDGWRGTLLRASVGSLRLSDGSVVDADPRIPERSDVERFEEALPPTEVFTGVPDAPETIQLDESYVRQYSELVAGEERRLLVQGICDPEGFPEWETRWLEVMDGGSCFWNASMDLASGEILGFIFHGVG